MFLSFLQCFTVDKYRLRSSEYLCLTLLQQRESYENPAGDASRVQIRKWDCRLSSPFLSTHTMPPIPLTFPVVKRREHFRKGNRSNFLSEYAASGQQITMTSLSVRTRTHYLNSSPRCRHGYSRKYQQVISEIL